MQSCLLLPLLQKADEAHCVAALVLEEQERKDGGRPDGQQRDGKHNAQHQLPHKLQVRTCTQHASDQAERKVLWPAAMLRALMPGGSISTDLQPAPHKAASSAYVLGTSGSRRPVDASTRSTNARPAPTTHSRAGVASAVQAGVGRCLPACAVLTAPSSPGGTGRAPGA